jgi:hypothetical protein
MQLDPEAMLQRTAANQHAAFSRRQALDAGLSAKTIDRYLRTGRWARSHRAGAAVWGWAEDLFVPEVTVLKTVRRRHPGIGVYRTCALEAVARDGFRVTKPMRTLVDLASCVAPERLGRMVDDAHRTGLIHPDRLMEYLVLPTNLARTGTGVLREIVASRSGPAIDSDLESLFFDALRTCRVPLPVPQHPVMTRQGEKFIDFAYPDRMIAIELDSWEHHGSRKAFEADRPRRNELERLGWHVLQFTWKAVTADPIGVAVTVAISLGLVPIKWR